MWELSEWGTPFFMERGLDVRIVNWIWIDDVEFSQLQCSARGIINDKSMHKFMHIYPTGLATL